MIVARFATPSRALAYVEFRGQGTIELMPDPRYPDHPYAVLDD